MKVFLLLWTFVAAVALASCSSSPELQIPVEVKVEVPVPCIPQASRPTRPATRTEADLKAMDRYRRTLAAWSDLKKLERYSAELEAIVDGCSRIAPAPR